MNPFRCSCLTFVLAACGGNEDPAQTPPPMHDASTGPSGDASAEPSLIQSGTLIELDEGKLRGGASEGARHFLGIPYAAPPTGDRRWKPPAPVTPWDGERDATEFGAACAQPSWIQGPESLEEDCLFLNVWTPEPAPTEPLPVMVWLPGGGNQNGSASDQSPLTMGALIYDGAGLAAAEDVVVVTLNYRLGAFGFFAHPGLRDEGVPAGNQGLQDQQAALRWVRDNVIAFGGDPSNVTLFGESAGSQDTCLHVVSPGADGLFHRAISQSGGCLTAKKTRNQAEAEAGAFAAALGCGDAADPLACLRGKPVSDLFADAPVDGGDPNAPGGSRFNGGVSRWEFDPIVDGEVIPDQPRTLVDSNRFAKVPYLLGANFEEGLLFMLAATPVQTEEEYLAALDRRFGDVAARVAAVYPASQFPTPQDALIRVWGDSRMVCSTQDTARRVAARGVPTYSYNFSRAIPGLEALRATHGVEMPYVFGTLADPGAEDQALSDLMQGYWARFARSGDPNGDGALEWPAFEGAGGSVMSFDVESAIEPGFRREECDLWETIYDAELQ